MKNIVLFVMFILLVGVALANPLEPLFTSRFWFDNAGDLNVRYTDQGSQAWQADLFDGVNHYQRQINPENPATLTQVYPDAAGTAQSGYLQVTNLAYPGFSEEVHWGPGEDDQITSLAPGQCGIQFYYAEGVENTIKLWGKDLISNPESIWGPTECSTLRVFCHTTAGTGIAGVPIYLFSPYAFWQQTGADGWVNHSIVSARVTVYVRDAQTNAIIYQNTLFTEPGITYTLDMIVSGSANADMEATSSPAVFSAHPSVLRSSGDRVLHLDYDGKIGSDLQAELYDLKGRLIASKAVSAAQTNWTMPELSSGVYFLRFSDRGRALGVRKLIVLK